MIKIAIFYSGYLPGKRYGGPVTSMFHFSEMFGDTYDIYIICKNHDFLEKTEYAGIHEGWNSVGKAKVRYLSDKEFSRKSFEFIIDELRPNLIYSSSIFSAKMNIPLLVISQKRSIPMLLAPRGELSKDRLSSKWWKKKPFIFLLKTSHILKGIKFQATSDYEFKDIISVLGINSKNVFLVPNIPCSVEKKKNDGKEKGVLKIVATSRIQNKNNQLYSIKIVNRMHSNVIFDIYGPKEDIEYWKKCEKEIQKAPSNITYNYKGVLPLDEIEKVYLNYDCLLHPTHSENYGHVIIEALCHDCPIVISKGTTPWDGVEDYNAGYTCELGSDDSFIRSLEHLANMDSEEYSILIKGVRDYIKLLDLNYIKNQYERMVQAIITK